jgi:hypothetical protein
MNALDDFLPDGFGFDALDEIARHLEIHISVEQREAHIAQRVGHVFLGDFPETAQILENVLELAGQTVEHGRNLREGAAIDNAQGSGTPG